MTANLVNRQINTEIKKVGKNALIYSCGNIAVKIVSFLLIPVYTYYLTIHDVGIIVLLELIELFYGYCATLGIPTAIYRYFYNVQNEGREKKYLSSNYLFMLGANTILLIILLVTSKFTAKYLLSDNNLTHLLQLFFIALFLGLSRMFLLTLLRIKEKPVFFIILVFIYFFMIMTLTTWFVFGLNLGLRGVVWAKLITSVLLFLFSFIWLVRQNGFFYDFSDVKLSLSYGLPMVFHGISLVFLSMSGRYFIKELISVEANGIFGIAYKFGMIINMILVTPFMQAWQPILFKLEKTPEQKLTYQKIALYFVQIGTFLWLFVSISGKYLLKWTTTEAYHEGIVIIPFIAFSYFLYGLQDVFKAGALLNNKTLAIAKCGIAAALLNVILNLVLIPGFALLGAAIATVLSFAFLMFLVLFLSAKYLKVNWLWKKMTTIILLGIFTFLFSLKEVSSVEIAFIKDASLIILLPVLLISFKLVSISEIKRFLRGEF